MSHIQQSSLGPFIQLFELNTDSQIFYFTPMTAADGSEVVYDGNHYVSLPVQIDGINRTSTQPARPTLRISQLNKFMFLAIASGDILGSTLVRRRTFQALLGSSSETLAVDRWVVMQINSLNKAECEFQLGSMFEKNTIKLPRKIVLQHEYPGIRTLAQT